MSASRGILDVVWHGKYGPDGALQRPDALELLQPLQSPLHGFVSKGNPMGGALVLGDNLSAMAAHAAAPLAGDGEKIKLVYIDPPFDLNQMMTGRFTVDGVKHEIPCYDDRWGEGKESFAYFLWQRFVAIHHLLDDEGAIFVHTNDHSLPLVRALLDDVFGRERYLNQIVWHYTGGGRTNSRFPNKHDVILWYTKSKRYTFNPDAIRVPYKETSAYAKSGIRAASGKHYKPHPEGTIPSDVWEIPIINPMSNERTGYPTQKPLALMERIILAASNEGDLVADFCCGSGSFLVAAAKHQRAFLGADASPIAFAHSLSRVGADAENFSAFLATRREGNDFVVLHGIHENAAFVLSGIDWNNAGTSEHPQAFSERVALASLNEEQDGEFLWGSRELSVGDSIPSEDQYQRHHGKMLNLVDASGRVFRGTFDLTSPSQILRRWV